MDTLKKVSIGFGIGLALSAYLQHERYEVEKEKEREDLATKEDVKALDAVANNDRYLKQIQVAKSCANSFRISQLVSRVEQCFPTSIATVSASGQQRTYTEFANRIRRAASGFVNELGVQPGDRIAILALNSESYLESFFSISMAGALPVPLNIRLSTQDLVDQLMDCECVALLVDEPMFVHVTQICNAVETLESIVTLGAVSPDHPVPPGSISLDILIESQEPLTEPVPFNGTEDIPENVYGIFYTGGTSGKAKGVMLTHEGLIFNAYTITNMVRFNDGIKYLHATPMFHLASGTAIFGVTMTGGTHVFIPKFAPDGVLRTIQEHKITHALLVPSMLQMLVSVPNLHDYDLRSVRYFTYGGSPMLEKTLLAALKAFPGAKFIQGYGMTEASPLMTLLGAEHHGVGSPVLTSVGQCVPHGELKILDPAGKEVPRGEVGEICYRGPNVMAGYYKTPEATMAVLRDNWLRTGDGGKMNENGFVFICDRIKDTINTGGENVYSQEVENCIAKLDGVLACAVIGIPDPVLVEKVTAIVVVKKDSKLTAEKVIEHCRARIARYKCPRAVFFRNDPLPLSGAGKVLKGILREPFWKNTEDASADVKPEPLVVVAKPTNNNTPSKISNNKNDNNHASDAK